MALPLAVGALEFCRVGFVRCERYDVFVREWSHFIRRASGHTHLHHDRRHMQLGFHPVPEPSFFAQDYHSCIACSGIVDRHWLLDLIHDVWAQSVKTTEPDQPLGML